MSTAPLLVEVIGGPKVVIDLDPTKTVEEIATTAASAVDRSLTADAGTATAWRVFAPTGRGGCAPPTPDSKLGKVAEAMRKLRDAGEPGGFAGPGTHEGKDYLFRIRLFVPSPPPPKPVDEAPPPIEDEEAIDLTNLDVDADELETVRHVELKPQRKKKRRRSDATRASSTGEGPRKKKRRSTGELPSQAGRSGRIRGRSTGDLPERASHTGRMRRKKRTSTRPPERSVPPTDTKPPVLQEVGPEPPAEEPTSPAPTPEPVDEPEVKAPPTTPAPTVKRPEPSGEGPAPSGPGTLTPAQQGAATKVMGQDAVAALLADEPEPAPANLATPPKPDALRPAPPTPKPPPKLEMPKRVPPKPVAAPETDSEATRPYRPSPAAKVATPETDPEATQPYNKSPGAKGATIGPAKSTPPKPTPPKPPKPTPPKPPEPTPPKPTPPKPPEPTPPEPPEEPSDPADEGKVSATRVVARALDVPSPEPGSQAMTGSVRRSETVRRSGTIRRSGSVPGSRSSAKLSRPPDSSKSTGSKSTGSGSRRGSKKRSSSGMLGLLAALLLFAAVTVAFVVVLLKTEGGAETDPETTTSAPAEPVRLSDGLAIEAWAWAAAGDPVGEAVVRFNAIGATAPSLAASPGRLTQVQEIAGQMGDLCNSGASFHGCEAWSRMAFAAYQGCRHGTCDDEVTRDWFLQSIQAADLTLDPLRALDEQARGDGLKRLTIHSVRLAGQSMAGLSGVSSQLATLARQACEGPLVSTPDCKDALADK